MMNEHSPKFQRVKRWTKEMVANAVTHPPAAPWITATEYQEITGDEYVSNADGTNE